MRFPPINPRAYAAGQVTGSAAAVALVASAPVQLVLALTAPGALLFAVTAVLSLMLVLPLLLYLRATPPVMLNDDGISLTPRIGKAVHVSWDAVREVKPYPLLPPENTEPLRRIAAGRRKFTPAEGLMLTSDALPWTYRPVGWFAGEGFRGAFAVTNRSHAEYPKLKKELERRIKR